MAVGRRTPAGQLRARPGRRAAAARRRRGRRVRVPARARARCSARRHDPAPHARRRALRRRPRPLRPLRAARARRPPRSRRRHAPRQRPVRPPLAARHARRCSRSPPSPPPSRARSAATSRAPGPAAAWPCCRWASRSTASARSRARRRASGSGSTPPAPTCSSRTIPSRPLKRFDRAREAAGDVPLLQMGRVPPEEVPYWINAANAVLVPSADEGFGLAAIEALACERAGARDAGRDPPGRAARRSTARSARSGTPSAGAPRSRRCSPRPTRGSTGARAPSCSPPTGWPIAWSRPGAPSSGNRAGRGRTAGERPILGGSSASATALGTDHERTPATHEALAPRRRRRAPCGGHGRRAGGWRGTPGRSRRGAATPRRPARPPRATPPRAWLTPTEPDEPAAAETPAAERAEQPEAPKPVLVANPDTPAGLALENQTTPRPPAGRRGRLRRRLRYLRRARELMLRDLGGLLYEVHRSGGGNVDAHATVLTTKVQRISGLDAEAHALETALASSRPEALVFEPGIGGTCPNCGELFSSAAHFCANCGASVTDLPAPAAPVGQLAMDVEAATPSPSPPASPPRRLRPLARRQPRARRGVPRGVPASRRPAPRRLALGCRATLRRGGLPSAGGSPASAGRERFMRRRSPLMVGRERGRRCARTAQYRRLLAVLRAPPCSRQRCRARPRPRAGHPVGGEQLGARAPVHPRVGRLELRRERGPPALASHAAQNAPSIPCSATGWIPTGVPNAGTPHASASITASPKPSSCDGTSTAFAALIQYGTSAGGTRPIVSSGTSPRPRARGRTASAAGTDRAGRADRGRRGRARAARAPRRAGSGGSGRARCPSAARPRAGASRRPGRCG